MLFAYGMTSIASGLTGSLVSGPSASRTAAVDAAGSRTQLSSLVAAGTVALVMVFFTDQLAYPAHCGIGRSCGQRRAEPD